jgi:CHAT domain-containing protein
VRWVDLGAMTAIDAKVAALRAAVSDPRRDAREAGRALDELLMRAIRPLAGDRRTLLLSTDGALNLVPFAALVDENGRHLAESFTIAYLSSGRDVLRLRSRSPIRQPALIVASPDFDDIGGAPRAVAAPTDDAPVRGSGLAGLRWAPLPGTLEEARELRVLLPTAKVVVGADASKTALRNVRGPSIVHLATHGFFLADVAPAAASDLLQIGALERRPATPGLDDDNPLIRSGLALAGANRIQRGNQDGILTALEAAALDLSGTRLVVLSACETGVGALSGAEGIYGLRRAFLMAGAESELVSLWKVEDQATRDLMVGFYRSALSGKVGRAEALRLAQLEMMKREGRAHPFFWASFIPIGDWRALDLNDAR